jgi:hypothetical protein
MPSENDGPSELPDSGLAATLGHDALEKRPQLAAAMKLAKQHKAPTTD